MTKKRSTEYFVKGMVEPLSAWTMKDTARNPKQRVGPIRAASQQLQTHRRSYGGKGLIR